MHQIDDELLADDERHWRRHGSAFDGNVDKPASVVEFIGAHKAAGEAQLIARVTALVPALIARIDGIDWSKCIRTRRHSRSCDWAAKRAVRFPRARPKRVR
jgi:hypothetical protein